MLEKLAAFVEFSTNQMVVGKNQYTQKEYAAKHDEQHNAGAASLIFL
jgi:hypothetical protein